ncbi:MAG: nitrile hydratase subunit alpha [Acidimicrobiales bacterium]
MTATAQTGPPHAPLGDHEEVPSDFEVLEIAVRELAIARGLISAADHRQWLEWMDAATPASGARLVAKAWVDTAYRERALANGTAAAQEIGINMYDRDPLIVMANTPDVHNLVVCTLCSCYPRAVLGLPPLWYKSPSYRRRAVRWPREVLAEFGTIIPPEVEIRVHDSNANMRYLVMPMRPAGTEDWTEDKLAAIVTRDTMIGVSVPTASMTPRP